MSDRSNQPANALRWSADQKPAWFELGGTRQASPWTLAPPDSTPAPGRFVSGQSCSWKLDDLDAPIRVARHLTAATLELWRRPDLIDDAITVVSELITNAFRHAKPPCVLTLDLDHTVRPTAVLIAVHDGDTTPPTDRAPGEDGGFGLAVIRALADLTVTPSPPGKTIYARIPTRLETKCHTH